MGGKCGMSPAEFFRACGKNSQIEKKEKKENMQKSKNRQKE